MNMISLMPISTPAPADATAFFNLLAVTADPEAAKKRLAELFEATRQANEAIATAKPALEELAVARKEHDQVLKNERIEHYRSLAEAKAKFEYECSKASDEIRAKRDAAEQLLAEAKADRTAAAELKADLQRRFVAVQLAVT